VKQTGEDSQRGRRHKNEAQECFKNRYSLVSLIFGHWETAIENVTVLPNIFFSIYDVRSNVLAGSSSVTSGLGFFVLALFYSEVLQGMVTHLANVYDVCKAKRHYALGVAVLVRFLLFLLLLFAASIGLYYQLEEMGAKMYDFNSSTAAFLITFLVGPFASQGTSCIVNMAYFAIANKATYEDQLVADLNPQLKQNRFIQKKQKLTFGEAMASGFRQTIDPVTFVFLAPPACAVLILLKSFALPNHPAIERFVNVTMWISFLQASMLVSLTFVFYTVVLCRKAKNDCRRRCCICVGLSPLAYFSLILTVYIVFPKL